ncbi:hypothetical protein FH972_021593 [Carpinus fangiana]|uniref:Uncharacterized protein n=1 Tax=Carpinus fangiana TaxID=176857 RepID=A0A5N6KPQ6_9ROSI|nr:hypothetical protein FH972_021593 [Carpinus fangiana]
MYPCQPLSPSPRVSTKPNWEKATPKLREQPAPRIESMEVPASPSREPAGLILHGMAAPDRSMAREKQSGKFHSEHRARATHGRGADHACRLFDSAKSLLLAKQSFAYARGFIGRALKRQIAAHTRRGRARVPARSFEPAQTAHTVRLLVAPLTVADGRPIVSMAWNEVVAAGTLAREFKTAQEVKTHLGLTESYDHIEIWREYQPWAKRDGATKAVARVCGEEEPFIECPKLAEYDVVSWRLRQIHRALREHWQKEQRQEKDGVGSDNGRTGEASGNPSQPEGKLQSSQPTTQTEGAGIASVSARTKDADEDPVQDPSRASRSALPPGSYDPVTEVYVPR